MRRRSQRWEVGDVFVVRLSNGTWVVGQIIGHEPKALNSVTVAFFDIRLVEPDLTTVGPLAHPVAFCIVFATRDELDRGTWQVIGRRPVLIPREHFPNEATRHKGWVGAKIIGSGNLNDLLESYYGLAPWDNWANPNYFDSLLLSPDKKPKNLVFKKQRPTGAG